MAHSLKIAAGVAPVAAALAVCIGGGLFAARCWIGRQPVQGFEPPKSAVVTAATPLPEPVLSTTLAELGRMYAADPDKTNHRLIDRRIRLTGEIEHVERIHLGASKTTRICVVLSDTTTGTRAVAWVRAENLKAPKGEGPGSPVRVTGYFWGGGQNDSGIVGFMLEEQPTTAYHREAPTR